jgi:anthranilate/para-aminobenzoate synthase component I
MSWKLVETLPWQEPLALAAHYASADMALLYSGLHEEFTGGLSYLFLHPLEEKSGDDWAQLPPLPPTADGLPLWIGYLGYGLREDGARGEASPITLPDYRLVRYGELFRFDHEQHVVERFDHGSDENDRILNPLPLREREGPAKREGEGAVEKDGASLHGPLTQPSPARGEGFRSELILPQTITPLTSNLTRAQYEHIVAATVARIHAGDFYQANITRKFYGEFKNSPSSRRMPGSPETHSGPLREIPGQARDDSTTIDSFALFTKLCEASPAPYSAYIRHGSSAILSSSPECFLSIDAAGTMTTRPIKGSARRAADEASDTKIRAALASSEKNHAENLMIVDLMRNDFSRVSEPSSVAVIEQSQLYSYRTIHHLISTIRAQKRVGVSVYDAVRACFPAGSMTGAPKIAAMQWCGAQEKLERGVYSGAIGWFGGGDTCDLSVVIRTLILDGNSFEFQVGGGIVADSTPEDEWRETLTKARGILTALGLSEADVAGL